MAFESINLNIGAAPDDGTGESLRSGGQKIKNDFALLAGATGADEIGDASSVKKFTSAAQLAKVDFLTVTQNVDLDAIETRVNGLDAAVVLRGTWDPTTGVFPGGGTAQAGDSWIASADGTVDGEPFKANDRIIAIVDNASTAVFAANWHKADYTDEVVSVAGLTGNITALALAGQLDLANVSGALNLPQLAGQPPGVLGNLGAGNPDPVVVNDAAAVLSFLNVEAGAEVNDTADEIAAKIDASVSAENTLKAALGFSKRLDGFQAHSVSGNLTTSELFKLNVIDANSVALTLPGSPFTGLTQGDYWPVLNLASEANTVQVATAGTESINAAATNSISIPPGKLVYVFFNSATDPQFYAEEPQVVPLTTSTILGADSDDTAYRALSPSEARTVMGVVIGTDVQAFDADILKADTADQLTAGFNSTVHDYGTQSTGTLTLAFANENTAKYVNGGAHTLAPPSSGNGTIVLLITNNASAGAITTSGFTAVDGDSFTTTDGHDFLAYVTKIEGFTHLSVKALQ